MRQQTLDDAYIYSSWMRSKLLNMLIKEQLNDEFYVLLNAIKFNITYPIRAIAIKPYCPLDVKQIDEVLSVTVDGGFIASLGNVYHIILKKAI